jgi:AcrR family transcriptional regulator
MTLLPKRPRGRPKDDALAERRRDAILDTAAAVFAEHGYPGADVQFIADALGVAKGTVYRYFPSKEELFLAAVDRGMLRLREYVLGRSDPVPDPLDRITRAVHAYLEFFKHHPQYVELLVQERAEFRDRKKPTYFAHREQNIGRWRDLFRQLIADGRVRDVPVERITDAISDMVYGTMFTNYFTGRHKPLDVQAGDLVDVVFHGILSDSERARRKAGK